MSGADIRLIAVDLDGTLLDDDHATVPARNVRARRAAAERGVAVAIASGRVWALLTEIADQLGPGTVKYAICSNGSAVLDTARGEWLCRRGLSQAQADGLFDLLRARRLPFEVYCEGENVVERGLLDLVRASAATPQFLETFERQTTFVDNLNVALAGRAVEKIHVFHVPPEERADLLREVEKLGPLTLACSFRENLELAAGGVNKGAALEALSARLGLDRSQVMAFGDAGNDLEMLTWAGWSFAMENAAPEIQAAARFTTLSNHAGGVGAAVEHWVLGK